MVNCREPEWSYERYSESVVRDRFNSLGDALCALAEHVDAVDVLHNTTHSDHWCEPTTLFGDGFEFTIKKAPRVTIPLLCRGTVTSGITFLTQP